MGEGREGAGAEERRGEGERREGERREGERRGIRAEMWEDTVPVTVTVAMTSTVACWLLSRQVYSPEDVGVACMTCRLPSSPISLSPQLRGEMTS